MPDAAALGNPGGATVARNVLPGPTGYKPFPAFAAETNALDSRPLGAMGAKSRSLVHYVYAGDATKLYRLSADAWVDVSRPLGYSSSLEPRWEFARFGNKVIATNLADFPQVISMGGSAFADLVTAFKARHVAVIRDYVVMAHTQEGGETLFDRVRWSGFADETDWTVSSITGSDVRDLNKGGEIQRVFGGQYGVILSKESTWRMTYTGAPTWFQIDETAPGIGAIAPGAATQYGDNIFYLSNNGFVRLSQGAQVTPIGAGRVDQFVLSDLDKDHLDRMSAAVDPDAQRVFWLYPGAGNTEGQPNRMVIYDWARDRWSSANVALELIWSATEAGRTLEDVDAINTDLDALTESLDDLDLQGGEPYIAGFDGSFESGRFSGAPMSAVVETKEVELNRGRRTTVVSARALADGGAATVAAGVRSNLADAVSWKSAGSSRPGGRVPMRASGRYHRFRVQLTGSWSHVLGVQVDPEDARPSGRRG